MPIAQSYLWKAADITFETAHASGSYSWNEIIYGNQICIDSNINSHFWMTYSLARYHLLLGLGKRPLPGPTL